MASALGVHAGLLDTVQWFFWALSLVLLIVVTLLYMAKVRPTRPRRHTLRILHSLNPPSLYFFCKKAECALKAVAIVSSRMGRSRSSQHLTPATPFTVQSVILSLSHLARPREHELETSFVLRACVRVCMC